MKFQELDKVFNPNSIAVIGASDNREHAGHWVIKNLETAGYKGSVHLINPNHTTVDNKPAVPSITQIKGTIDLAVIATPAFTVPQVVKDCAQSQVKGIVILSAGFKEAGADGEKLTSEVMETAAKYGIRIIGPNCLGFIRPSSHVNVTFAKTQALPGNIAFISQSGALCSSILDWAYSHHVGFSNFISIGDMIDIGYHDLIDYFGEDTKTTSILVYMESLTHARRFMSAARSFARTKPIVVLKSGRSSQGAHAALSHTGNLAGNDTAYDAAFKRSGILRVNTVAELFDSALALSHRHQPTGNKLAIITNAGGPGVIATDALISLGGELTEFSPETKTALLSVLPKHASIGNPVDVLGDASSDTVAKAVNIAIRDLNTYAVLIIITPQAMTDELGIAKKIQSIHNIANKPILVCYMGEASVNEAREYLKKNGISVYETPENAVKAFMNMYSYVKNIQLLHETPSTIPSAFSPEKEKAERLIESIVKQGRNTLTEPEVKKLLSLYDIPVTKHAVVRTAFEAGRAATKIGFPVAMKIVSPEILHKTDVGGVKLNIRTAAEAKNAFISITTSIAKHHPKAWIHGVLIEEMCKKQYELVIGAKKDELFGPVIVFGMGGVAVEVFKDINSGLPPLNMALAKQMIEETKVYKLLAGYRNMPAVDIESIQFLLYKFAYLVADFPLIKECDINPFGVDAEGGMVLDAKIILDESLFGKTIPSYSHLTISPYPKQYITSFTMKNGQQVLLRPIRPEDEPLEAEMFTTFSEQTQRFRFFGLKKNVTHDLLIRYTQIDYDREIAIIAELTLAGEKKMIGVVRLIADPYGETAEFAIVLGDPWQGQGLGSKMTDYMLEIAKSRNIKTVYAFVLKDNEFMIEMFKKRGFNLIEEDDHYRVEKQV